jgi:fucose permease
MRRSKLLVLFILVVWFVISFVTNILGPIMPALISDFELSLTMAAFLPFSFFLAYGVMSVPAGIMIERIGEKLSMIIAFSLTFAGSLIFALFPIYEIGLVSLFLIGIGMAMLQVIINPLMREAGGEENFAFYSVLGQLVFGAASFVSPHVFTYLVRELSKSDDSTSSLINVIRNLVPADLPWSSLYWVFTIVFLFVLIIVFIIKFPKVELKEDEKSERASTYLQLLKDPKVILFFLGIIAYVGTEQGLANWMSKFLNVYHDVDPEGAGASTISLFWGLMSIGCLIGLLLLKLVESRMVLKIFSLLSMISVALALFGNTQISLIAFPLSGFFISVMFSIIFSLALNSMNKHHGAFSGILCSGIFGGALVPLIIGWIGDFVGLKLAMTFLFVTLAYVLSIGFWAKPMINNKTYSVKELLKIK